MGLHRRDLLLGAGAIATGLVLGNQHSLGSTNSNGRPMQGPLLTPHTAAYDACLSGLHNGTAAAEEPALIAQPRNEAEVIEAIQLAQQRGLAISVCSGSHSALCSRSGTLMLDLASGFHRITPRGERVTVQAGASMGGLLRALAPSGRMVPVGTHATPGFGLLTMGGIGHLSRSLGLTVDHIEELRGVTAQGQPFRLTAADGDRELWTLLRGAAIFLVVITEATLRTDPRQRLLAVRQLQPLAELAAIINAAEALPRQGSCSLILGFAPEQQEPQVLTYAVAAEEQGEVLESFRRVPGAWSQVGGGLEELPAFELPGGDGSVPAQPAASGDRHRRMRTRVYSISLPRGLAASLSTVLTQTLRRAPNRECRIDLQHVGGVVNEVPIDATAYRGRRAEWSIVVTAVWPAADQSAATAACQWADACFDALAPLANHYYIVQRQPGTSRYTRELDLAYGPMLNQLRQRKLAMDPKGALASLT